MVIDTVEQGDHWVIGEGTLNLVVNMSRMEFKILTYPNTYLVGVPLVEAELAIAVSVMRVVAATLVLLVLHEVEIPAGNISLHINIS